MQNLGNYNLYRSGLIMAGFFGMFGKKSEAPSSTTPPAAPTNMKAPAPRPPGVGAPPPIADFPSSIMGLKAPKPLGNKVAKSTQRIVLPAQKTGPLSQTLKTGPLGTQNQVDPTMRISIPGKAQGAASSMAATISPEDKISLPVSVAFRSLPPDVLSEQAQLAVNPTDEFLIPLYLIIPQLPTGKIEFSIQQMMEFLPHAIFKSPTEIAGSMDKKVLLPMMEVFTRIPAQKLQSKADMTSPSTPRIIPDSKLVSGVDPKKTRPINVLIPPAPPKFESQILREEAETAAETQLVSPVPAPPKAPAAPHVPLIPPPPVVAPQTPEVMPSEPSFSPQAPSLESLMAAAASALGDEVAENKTVPMPPSQEFVSEPLEVPVVIPPPPVATVSVPVPHAPPLEALLQAAQDALGDVPQGDQTIVIEELQEDKIDPVGIDPVEAEIVRPSPDLTEVTAPMVEMSLIPPTPVSIPKPVESSAPLIPSDVIPVVEVQAGKVDPTPEPAPSDVAVPEEELDLNRCLEPQLIKTIRCSSELAKSIVSYRQMRGGFSKLEDLARVPGMTDAVFYSLTGQHSEVGTLVSLNEILNLDASLTVTAEQALARISLWPGVRGALVQKGGKKIGELFGVTDLDAFLQKTEDCLKTSVALVPTAGLVRELILRDEKGSWIILQRGSTLLVSGFQEQVMPEALRWVLEKIVIELHERLS